VKFPTNKTNQTNQTNPTVFSLSPTAYPHGIAFAVHMGHIHSRHNRYGPDLNLPELAGKHHPLFDVVVIFAKALDNRPFPDQPRLIRSHATCPRPARHRQPIARPATGAIRAASYTSGV